MARLLVIARSSRELDMKEIIGAYELSATNQLLMTGDGRLQSLHPCQEKAQLMHQLEQLGALAEPAANPVSANTNATSAAQTAANAVSDSTNAQVPDNTASTPVSENKYRDS